MDGTVGAMASVRIDGTDLNYQEHGTGPPLLLIHGNGGGAAVWGGTVATLARDFRVIAYDRRGFGRSVHPPVRDWRRHGNDAASLLRALDAAPATVVGWSGGGITALDLAVHDPGVVSALVLAEPPLHAKRHLSARMAATMIRAQLLRRTRGERAAAEHFYRWASRYTTGGCAYDRFPATLQAAMRDTASATLAELDAGTGEHLTAAAIGSISCPVTCPVGDLSDPVFAAATRRLTRMLPQATVVPITGAGHALHFDQPEQFAASVRSAGERPGTQFRPTTASDPTKETQR
jgi:pimeloyl-ACP methyl ester carboxylesterase